jgi:hypothetical protein
LRGAVPALAAALLLALAACADRPPPAPQPAALPPPTGPLECVPYARQVSGIDIRGDAWTWWGQAAGRYPRGPAPQPGAVLAFRRTERLPLGHVAVVTQVLNPRAILITHANWGDSPDTRGRIARDVPVIDISPANDWSQLRVWNGEAFGRVYPAHGFIYRRSGTVGA